MNEILALCLLNLVIGFVSGMYVHRQISKAKTQEPPPLPNEE